MLNVIYPSMAQLDNAADSDSEERGFESLWAGQNENPSTFVDGIFVFYYSFFIIQYSSFIRQDFQLISNNEIASLMNNE